MKKIGLVVAMEGEMREIYDTLGEIERVEICGELKVTIYNAHEARLYMVSSGIGEISATMATTLLIVKYGVEAIINFGLVGSLSSRYRRGDNIMVKEVVHYDFALSSDKDACGKYPFNRESFVNRIAHIEKIAKELDLPTCRIASGDKFIEDSEFKQWLVNQFSAEICDMESMGIYIAARNWNVPLYMIKSVSDNADETAQIDFMGTLEQGVTAYIAVVHRLIKLL